MAAPNYNVDLVTISQAETTTGYSQVNYSGGGGAALDQGPDLAMESASCVLRQVSAHDRGAVYDNGTTIPAVTGSGVHVYQWIFTGSPGITDTIQNTGVTVIIGSTTANVNRFHVDGSDTFGASGRVGKCYAVRYVTTGNASPPYRSLTGTPTSPPQVFGASINVIPTSKGFNLGVDATRYGTGMYVTGGEAGNPCNFSESAGFNDAVPQAPAEGRFGVFSLIGGGYELQGTYGIGRDINGNATASYFDDADANISLVDAIHAESTFNRVIIDDANTFCRWSNINITALGTTAPGQLTVTSNNPTFQVTGSTFTGIGVTTLNSNTYIDGTTWRRSAEIYQSGSTIENATVDNANATMSLYSDTPNIIQNCTFNANTDLVTGSAIEITVTGSFPFIGNSFNGYGADDSATAAIYNNSGGAVTMSVSDAIAPTVRNGTGATTLVEATTPVTVTELKDNSEVRVVSGSPPVELAGIESASVGTEDNREFTFSLAPGLVVDIHIHNTSGWQFKKFDNYTIPGSSTDLPAGQIIDRVSD